MTVLLPAAVFLVLLVLCERRMRLRRAVLVSSVVWGGLVVVWTETLSLFGALSAGGLALGWTVSLVLLGQLAWLEGVGETRRYFPDRWPSVVSTVRTHPVSAGLLVGCFVLLAGVLTVALLGAPNNGDSMSYHLPRVMHWIQNGSVRHYSTWIPRQLYQPPMAEFTVLQFHLLYGSDRFANLVQWFALVGSGLAASLIAARLGAGGVGQVFGFLFVVTLPMGLLQGMTTQNDLVLGFWLAAGTYFCVEAFDQPRERIAWKSVVPLALCLGLAVLTKATGYLFGFPLLAAAVILGMYRHAGRGLRIVLVCLLVVLFLNAGHYTRNTIAFNNPLMPEDLPFVYLNRTLTPATLTSNVVRNLALQAATPFGPVNDEIEQSVETLHHWMDLPVNDRRITWRYSRFRVKSKLLNENHASNPLHFGLVAIVFVGIGLGVTSGRRGVYRWMTAGILAAFLVFCLVLQWQPWHSRLHLPLFVVAAPLAGAWMEERLGTKGLVVLGGVLLLLGAGVVLMNRSHPMVGGPGNLFRTPRESQYFTNRPGLEAPYRRITTRIQRRGCQHVGLMVGLEEWVYPLWVLLSAPGETAPVIRHVTPPRGPEPPAYFLERDTPVCAMVCTVPGCEKWMQGEPWTPGWKAGSLQLWFRTDFARRGRSASPETAGPDRTSSGRLELLPADCGIGERG